MIQRIQTIYLLLAFICSAILLFIPVFSLDVYFFEEDKNSVILTAYGFQKDQTLVSFPFYIFFILSSLLTFMAILFYKNRPKQIKITRLNLIINLMISGGFLIFSLFGKNAIINSLKEEGFGNIEKIQFVPNLGYFLLFLTLPFLFLAIRGIKSDENLVKSLDRLR